jgi:ketosteroid isomerase-like protein
MSDQNLAVVRGAYESFGRGDIPAVLAVLADDVEWSAAPTVLPHGVKVGSRDEVGSFFQGLGSTWSDFSVDVKDFLTNGDHVCVVGRADGNLGGTRTGYGFVHYWTLRDGVCVRFDEYVDPDAELVGK